MVTEYAELAGGDAAEAAVALGIGVPSATDDDALPGRTDLPAVGRMRTFPAWTTCGAWALTRNSSNWTRTKPARSRARSRRLGQTATMTRCWTSGR